MSRRARVGMVFLSVVGGATPAGAVAAAAQDVVVDRWLAAVGGAESGDNPLVASGARLFPDRDLVVGPGRWTLVREDGQTSFDFSEFSDAGQTTLAHVYVKAPADTNAWLAFGVDSCARLDVWLNGQPLREPQAPRDVRLAGGWNTLFAVIDGDEGCARSLSASLSRGRGPTEGDRSRADVFGISVQASRPPGVRPNFPDGGVTVSAPRVTGLTWNAGRDDLEASVAYDLTSWGRGGLFPVASNARDEPPAIDLTGEWALTLFGPTGIQHLLARIEMDEDGEVTGDLRGDRRDLESGRQRSRFTGIEEFEGRIREGRVSGRRFSWTVRTDVLGRTVDLKFEGTVQEGELRGTIDLSELGDDVVSRVGSRFEAKRSDAEEDEEPAVGEAEAADSVPPTGAPVPEVGIRSAGSDTPEETGPRDPTGQRAQMIRQLLGSPARKASAPLDGSAELRLAGESLVVASGGFVAALPVEFDGSLPFRKLRDAALRDDGVRVKIRWNGEDRDLSGWVPADRVLEALHRPIDVGGLVEGADGVARAELRVPDVLAGFTILGGEGAWWVDGEAAADRVLCSPCERGRRIEIGFQAEGNVSPRVQIRDQGYPDLAEESGVPALEWLRALEGDNRKYRELAGS